MKMSSKMFDHQNPAQLLLIKVETSAVHSQTRLYFKGRLVNFLFIIHKGGTKTNKLTKYLLSNLIGKIVPETSDLGWENEYIKMQGNRESVIRTKQVSGYKVRKTNENRRIAYSVKRNSQKNVKFKTQLKLKYEIKVENTIFNHRKQKIPIFKTVSSCLRLKYQCYKTILEFRRQIVTNSLTPRLRSDSSKYCARQTRTVGKLFR